MSEGEDRQRQRAELSLSLSTINTTKQRNHDHHVSLTDMRTLLLELRPSLPARSIIQQQQHFSFIVSASVLGLVLAGLEKQTARLAQLPARREHAEQGPPHEKYADPAPHARL